ncbi:homologous-pairing protein 2 homolog isoform X2 [Oncorhynchus tshawytscha]|uniref:Homologous-pairing protein 2 homolog n=1 Tax=Oncorhynchus tshawytscha TaxID=74940 RepID=A0AAZ3P094_ONCTS|nr:homologous-pairing protein 2 homolog isoform X2 [Oncorhynchus tshawytscha]
MSKKDNGGLTVIFAYLNEKNRPYSAQDVFNNLQKQHGLGKTAVVKAMEQLALEGKIKEKTYGKQKIYFADQAQFAEVSEADLKAIDSRISDLSTQVQVISQGCRQLDTELKELNSSLTTEEMISEIQELKEVCSGYRENLEKIKSATNHVTPEQKEMAADMMGSILEGYPKTKKQFLEEVGVETDEDCKVTMPST